MRSEAQADQAEQGARKRVHFALRRFPPLKRQVKTVFLPSPIKKRNEAMVEQVQPILQGRLLRPFGGFLGGILRIGPEPFRVNARQDAVGTRQAHEVHRHQRSLAADRRRQFLDRTRRERERQMGQEPRDLALRRTIPPPTSTRSFNPSSVIMRID